MNKEDLSKIESDILKNTSLSLRENGLLVLGKGNAQAKILFIGEAPGKKESEQGIPFVGAAGRELNKLLAVCGLTQDDCYIANILKYRPPNNRDPNKEEIAEHTPYLVRQISVIKPKIIIPLGNFATKFVLSGFQTDGMKKIKGISLLHGQKHEVTVNEVTYTVIPSYHPAAMLYKPPLRAVIENDFIEMKKILG